MKLFYLLMIAGLSLPLLADSPPNYLGQTKATVLTSLTTRGTVNVTPGTPENCIRTEASSLILYRCDVKGAVATYQDDKGSISFPYSRLVVMYKTYQGQLYREFTFFGDWKEKGPVDLSSSTKLTLVVNALTPTSAYGTISLAGYNLAYPVQATVAKE